MLEKKRVSFRPMNEDDLVLMLKWLTEVLSRIMRKLVCRLWLDEVSQQ